jgi:hypothetical protein
VWPAVVAGAIEGRRVRREVLILSPYFPPSTLAGVHRARHLAKHLPAFGWIPVVACVDEKYHEERLDPDLAALVAGDIQIIKVAAVSARLSRCIGIGDVSLRAWRYLKQTVFRTIEKGSVGAVLITGAPFYPMLLASEIKRRFGIPIILDFQDPWASAWGATRPVLSKAGLSHRVSTFLEPRALRGADFVTSVSDTQNAEMVARYPWLDSARMAAIPIGGDPDDFAAIHLQSAEDDGDLESAFINLSYVGTFLPRSGPLVRTLFRAFARLRSNEPAVAARIRLNFVGTSNQPNGDSTFQVRPIAEEEGVSAAVREIPQRLPYLRALKVLTRSNGLLLIGSDEPHYTASKIYPALISNKPFLSLFHRASSAHAILSAAGGGRALAFETIDELAELEGPLEQGLRSLALSPESFGATDPVAYAPYEARNIARRFAEIFDLVAANKARD